MQSLRLFKSKLKYLCDISSQDLLRNGRLGAYVTHRNYSSAYDADGKTYGKVLNKRDIEDILLIDSLTERGFRLTNTIEVFGPTIIFPHSILSWNIDSAEDINEDSLSLFGIMEPKIDFLIIGYGESKNYTKEIQLNVFKACKKYKLNFEAMTTDNAVSTFNFLAYDRRYIAAALIPPVEVSFFGMGNEINRKDAVEEQIDSENDLMRTRIPRPKDKPEDWKTTIVGSGR